MLYYPHFAKEGSETQNQEVMQPGCDLGPWNWRSSVIRGRQDEQAVSFRAGSVLAESHVSPPPVTGDETDVLASIPEQQGSVGGKRVWKVQG